MLPRYSDATNLRIPGFFEKLPKLPFASFVNVVPNGEPIHALHIPHYVLRLTSLKTAERHIVMMRFSGVKWDGRKYEEKVVVDLLSNWLKELVAVASAQDESETFELMPSATRWSMGHEERKAGMKDDEFFLEEAKKLFQTMVNYADTKTQFMGHLGPRMNLSMHRMDTATPSFSIDGSWNISSHFSLSALANKSIEEFRKEIASSSDGYHSSFLSATAKLNGHDVAFQCRDDVLGELFPRLVDRKSVEEELNKLIAKWIRTGFGADTLGNVSLSLDWIEREGE